MYLIAVISITINILLIFFMWFLRTTKPEEMKDTEPYRGKRVSFTSVGLVQPGKGTINYVVRSSFPFRIVKCIVNVPPEGHSIILDINKNGTTIFSDQENRPTINPGEVMTIAELKETVVYTPGDRITVDVDQVGSTYPGSDLVLYLEEVI